MEMFNGASKRKSRNAPRFLFERLDYNSAAYVRQAFQPDSLVWDNGEIGSGWKA